MKRLAIETATDLASVALRVGDQICVAEHPSSRQHAESLLPMIEGLLQAMQLPFSQLDGIAFGCGPGSFTGLRVACSLAKGLALSHELPLYPMSSLALMAEALSASEPGDTPILAILDARMHQFYWQVFNAEGRALTAPVVTAASEIQYPTVVRIAGLGFDPEQAPQLHLQGVHTVYPHARTMLSDRLMMQQQAVTAEEALPLYVRDQVVIGDRSDR